MQVAMATLSVVSVRASTEMVFSMKQIHEIQDDEELLVFSIEQ